jgi:pyrroline-5-carboxylate reductase
MQLNLSQQSILLVGCGRMGSAMLTGWQKSGLQNMSISDPAHANHIDVSSVSTPFDIVVLAIKPQQADEILPTLQSHITPSTLILSIMAGVTISKIETLLNHTGAIFRAMPNTPAMIGAGITVISKNARASNEQTQIVSSLLTPLGDVVSLDDENLMNAVTALSGSGPAYLFYVIEVLSAAGVKQGLPPAIAMELARKTMIGSALLAQSEPNTTATELRENVTSKGGTTEAALQILMQNNELQALFDKAIEAATKRFQ